MRRSFARLGAVLAALALALPVMADQPPAIIQAGQNPIGFTKAINGRYRATDQRPPTVNDDVVASPFNQPGKDWIDWSTGTVYRAMQTGYGAAVWVKRPIPALPLDVVGIPVSTCTPVAGGTGHAVNDVVTDAAGILCKVTTVSTGAITAATPVFGSNRYKGGCTNPGTVAQTATTGAGTGATFSHTFAFPRAVSKLRLTQCYTGNIMQVKNTVTQVAQDISYVAGSNMYDFQKALGVGRGATPETNCAAYNSVGCSWSAVVKLYDQGGTGDAANVTAAVATAPWIVGTRTTGGVVTGAQIPTISFAANGVSGAAAQPSQSFMTIPAGWSFTASGAAVTVAGSNMNTNSRFVSLGPSAGSNYFGIGFGAPISGNSTDSGAINWPYTLSAGEQGSVMTASANANVPTFDSSLQPWSLLSIFARISAGTVAAGQTITFTPNNGTLGAGGQAVTYTVTAADAASTSPPAAQMAMQGLMAAINADATMRAAGITANLVQSAASGYIQINFPNVAPASAWGYTLTSVGGLTMATSTAAPGVLMGGSYAGGKIGYNDANNWTGFVGVDAVIYWPTGLTTQEIQDLRESLDYWLQYTPQIGAVVLNVGASNMAGYQTPCPYCFSQTSTLPQLLGRSDVLVLNMTASGTYIGTFPFNWYGTPSTSAGTGTNSLRSHLGQQSNNIILVQGTYNDFGTQTYTAGAASNVLTVSAVGGGQITKGQVITVGMTGNPTITGTALDGPTACNGSPCTGLGGTGTYAVSSAQTVSGGTAFTSYGTPTSLLNSYQYIATLAAATSLRPTGDPSCTVIPAYCQGVWVVAEPETTKSAGTYPGPGGGTYQAQMASFAGTITAANCASAAANCIVVNPQAQPIFAIQSNFQQPLWEPNDSYGHLSYIGNQMLNGLTAQALYGLLQ